MAPVWEKGGGRIFVLKSWWEIFHHVIFFLLFNSPCIPLLSLVLAEKMLNISSSSKGTLPLHLLFSSEKDGPQRNHVWEGEFAVLSPSYHFLRLWNVLTLLAMPYDTLQDSFTHENFPWTWTSAATDKPPGRSNPAFLLWGSHSQFQKTLPGI